MVSLIGFHSNAEKEIIIFHGYFMFHMIFMDRKQVFFHCSKTRETHEVKPLLKAEPSVCGGGVCLVVDLSTVYFRLVVSEE